MQSLHFLLYPYGLRKKTPKYLLYLLPEDADAQGLAANPRCKGGENIDNVMCTAKVFAKVNDARKLRDGLVMDRFGIHTNAILGDLRQPIKDIAVLLGLDIVETDK